MIADKKLRNVKTTCVHAGICMIYLQNIPVDVDNENKSF